MERVEDDVAFGLEARGWPVGRMRQRVPEALADAGLDGLGRRRSRRLSGGQQQRLALAGVLAALPGLLVLDEPTANLDPPGAAAFLDRVAALGRTRTTSVVLIEHRVEQAWAMADMVLALDAGGRPIDVGLPGEVAARSARVMYRAGIWLPAAVEQSVALPGRVVPPSPLGRADQPREIVAGSGPPTPARPGPSQVAIEARGLTFSYESGHPAVRDVSLSIAPAERVALVGPNGGGKSTLARVLVGLLRPDRGSIRLGGDDPARLPAARLARRAAYVFQEPERQFLAERVHDEILLGLAPSARPGAERLLADLGLPLDRFGDRSPFRLSGGEARQLSLAIALVRDPAVLVLDEPTFGQDHANYDRLLGILGGHLRAGTTLIAATHDERFVADVADRVITMADGRVTADERTR